MEQKNSSRDFEERCKNRKNEWAPPPEQNPAPSKNKGDATTIPLEDTRSRTSQHRATILTDKFRTGLKKTIATLHREGEKTC